MRKLLLAVALLCVAFPASAQDDQPDPFKTARMRIGPLALTPTVTVTDVGIDTNVFNDWTDPKRDFTATLKPGTDMWLRLGKARVSAKGNVGFLYFNEYSNERSLSTDDSVRLEFPLMHIRPWAGLFYVNTRERQGFEIDARARSNQQALSAGTDLTVSTKATIAVTARRTRFAYAADAEFLGTHLRDAFNRRTDSLGAALRYKVTPLTTLVLSADRERDRFDFSPVRDSDSARVMPGLEFDTAALIDGSASVGYRSFDMLAPGIPDYRGPVAALGLGYTLLGITRFQVQAQRDIAYSFDVNQPYYVLTGASISITQRVGGPFDVQARGGRQRLDYRHVSTGVSVEPGRRDSVTLYGGGVGYHLGRSARLGFNIDAYQRRSPATTREFRSVRVGTSLTYGL